MPSRKCVPRSTSKCSRTACQKYCTSGSDCCAVNWYAIYILCCCVCLSASIFFSITLSNYILLFTGLTLKRTICNCRKRSFFLCLCLLFLNLINNFCKDDKSCMFISCSCKFLLEHQALFTGFIKKIYYQILMRDLS